MTTGVAVLVVGYRQPRLLDRCLMSVAAHLPDASVHVWDNSGPDADGLDEVVSAWPAVHWRRSELNVGFAAAVNALAAEVLAESGASDDVLLLLNPDAELLSPLTATLAAVRTPGVAAAAPLALDDRPGRRPWDVAHGPAGLVRSLVARAGYAPALRRTPLSDLYPAAPREVTGYLTGACLALHASAWRSVGPFDEEFFLYGEEVDWQRRARAAGWGLRLVHEPGVRHRGHGTVTGDAATAQRSQDLLAANIALNLERRRGHGVHAADAYLAGTAALDRIQRSRRHARAAARVPASRPSVVLTVNRLVRGGAERHHAVLARELQRRGHEVVIVCLQRFGPLLTEIPPEVRVIRQPWWAPAVDLPTGPAVVISGDTNTETGWATAWRLGRRDRRWLVGAHVPPEPDGPTYGATLATAMGRADGFVALSERHRDMLGAHHHLARRWFIAPNGVDASTLPTALAVAESAERAASGVGRARLVMLSRIVAHKNPHLLVDALAGLADLDWELAIHGDGPDRERLQALTPAAVADRVQWRGWSPGPDAALADADLLCVPSGAEAFPMVIVEAMVRGVPVIASAVCSVPEMLDHGRAGLLVDRVDVEGWRAAIRQALETRERWPAIGQAGRMRATEHYTVAVMADAYETAIDAVLADQGRG